MKQTVSALFGFMVATAIMPNLLYATSVINFKSPTFEINELDSVKSVTVTCTPPPPSGTNISAQLRIVGGTASGADFVFPHSGFDVVFWPGASEVTASIPVIDDGLPEGDETLLLQITDIQGDAVPGTLTNATIIIHNGAPMLGALADPTLEGGEVRWVVWRRGDTNIVISVDYAATNDTALAGIDFVPQSGTLTFAPGDQQKDIQIPLINNGRVEAMRSFGVQLSNPSPAVVALANDGYSSVAIVDDETPVYVNRQFASNTAKLGLSDIPPALTIQPDGKIITLYAEALVRLQADGSPDPQFTAAIPSATNQAGVLVDASITDSVLDGQGRLFVTGTFEAINGIPRPGLARLLSDGTLDLSFSPPPDWSPIDDGMGSDVGFSVPSLSLESDNRLLLYYGGGQLRRISEDGSWDPSFAPDLTGLRVRHMVSLPNGKVLVAVQPTNAWAFELMRLEADGRNDPTFHRPVFNGVIADLHVQDDGAILVSGGFDRVDDHQQRGLVRLHPDGTLDDTFDPSSSFWGSSVSSVASDSRGRVLIGKIDNGGPDPQLQILRLNADGSLDPTFVAFNLGQLVSDLDHDSGGGAYVYKLVHEHGRTLVSGLVIGGPPGPEQPRRPMTPVLLALHEDLPANSIEFTRGQFYAEDGWESAAITVKRIGNTEGSATVHYATRDGTALAGIHYQPQTGVLTFAPMETLKLFTVPLMFGALETPRELSLNLTEESGLVGFGQARLVILAGVGLSIQSVCGLPSVELLGAPSALGSWFELFHSPSLASPLAWQPVTSGTVRTPVLRLNAWSDWRTLIPTFDSASGFFKLVTP